MNYCMEYTRKFRYMDEDDVEFFINYNGNDDAVFSYLNEIKHKTIIDMVEHKDIIIPFIIKDKFQLYVEIQEQYNCNIVFRLPDNDDGRNFAGKLKEYGLKFMFNKRVSSWDDLYEMINLGVSEVYICNEMGFDLKSIVKITKPKEIKIRVYPNVCQLCAGSSDYLKGFFVRPEDTDLYADYVDTFEFWGEKFQYSVVYETYKIKKEWYGELSEIICGFDMPLDNRCIVPSFGETRIRCGKRCYKGESCFICEAVESLARTLSDNNLILQ